MSTALANERCTSCRGGDPPLSLEEAEQKRGLIALWQLVGRNDNLRLTRSYEFTDFKGALAFTQRIGERAEAEGHHPTLVTEWGKVTVVWWTHKINGLHHNDFIMAAKTDLAYAQEGPV